MGRCKKGKMCRFAHCIQDVLPPPDTWTACPTHWWRPGLPIPEHLELIMKYISWSKDPLPKWAMQLQSKVGDPSQMKEAELHNEVVEAKMSGPPAKKHRRHDNDLESFHPMSMIPQMRDAELFTLDILRSVFGWTAEGLSDDFPGTSIRRMKIGNLSFKIHLS